MERFRRGADICRSVGIHVAALEVGHAVEKEPSPLPENECITFPRARRVGEVRGRTHRLPPCRRSSVVIDVRVCQGCLATALDEDATALRGTRARSASIALEETAEGDG